MELSLVFNDIWRCVGIFPVSVEGGVKANVDDESRRVPPAASADAVEEKTMVFIFDFSSSIWAWYLLLIRLIFVSSSIMKTLWTVWCCESEKALYWPSPQPWPLDQRHLTLRHGRSLGGARRGGALFGFSIFGKRFPGSFGMMAGCWLDVGGCELWVATCELDRLRQNT